MKGKRVLYISSEVIPYLPETPISSISYRAPSMVKKRGGQIRIFMPRFGNINERRHQLHEVIRLSGMNLVVNDLDMPLIIKVASIPKDRIQVYFIDNEEYFKRKATTTDEEGNLFSDNDERAIFFAKGVIETVKKLNWNPDIIHVQGWMASLVPMYLRNYYANDPLFEESKIVTSVFETGYEGSLDADMAKKISYDDIDKDVLSVIDEPTYDNLMKLAMTHSDGVIQGSENLSDELQKFFDGLDKPTLGYHNLDEFADPYEDFYLNKLGTATEE